MKPMIKGICASALALSMAVSGIVPAMAIPMQAPSSQIEHTDIIKVQSRHDRRQHRHHRGHGRFEHRNGHYYYNGHRGYRTYHRGYRRHNGYWFPPAAFVAGAIIGGAMANSGTRTVSSAHVQWCQNRYRSYRMSDDTFQPYNGPRQRCHSPYD